VKSRIALIALVVACGDPRARVELAPVNPCGAVENESAVRVIAYTAGGEQRRVVPPDTIDTFAADTEQLGVEVIGMGGALVAIGKTAPLEFTALEDGATIPIVMLPPNGFCPTVGAMTETRVAPVVAHTRGGVLVAGGRDASGVPLSTAEYYDAATATFSAVEVPASLVDASNGLAGAVLTELSDGRVALSGTASHALAIFSPDTRRFSPPDLFDHRAFHAAIAPDPEHLFIIGGCAEVLDGACDGPALRTGFNYLVEDVTMRERGAQLPDNAQRYSAQIIDVGIQRDGVHRYVLVGGTGDPGVADRFALADFVTESIAGMFAQDAPLDGGAILTAFDPDGSTQQGRVGVLAPDGAVVPVAFGPRVDGMRLAAAEDGSVVAIGPAVSRYVPTTDSWQPIAPPSAPLFAPVLVRLDDGSLLVLGARDPSAQAWLYRPSLVGPRSGSITVLPDGSTEGVLTATDPSHLDRTDAHFTLVGDDDYGARALVGGPRMDQGSINGVVRVRAGGVALVAEQTDPGRAFIGRLVPGEPARIEQLVDGTTKTLCTGSQVTSEELVAAVGFSITNGSATLTVGAPGAPATKASCAVPVTARGAWGIAAAGSGARIEVGPVTVARARSD